MPRMILDLPRPAQIRYLDTLHAGLVTALRRAGAEEQQVIGTAAAAWTFAISGRSSAGGLIRVNSVTLSTPDPALGAAMLRINGADACVRSSNGDVLDLTGATCRPVPVPLHPDQDRMAIGFASPFLVSERGTKKTYARSLAGLDLSAAFSAGLSRRLGRPFSLQVEQDRLSAATDGAAPMLVRVRRSGTRDLILPALSAVLTLCGKPADLRDAYLAGLGEKTRYGFGCPAALA
jgi:CRISPR-associated endoribonuclease Cas6